jgi:hypothetical protein
MVKGHATAHAGVVVSFNAGDVPGADDVDHLVGLRTVSHQITQTEDSVGGLGVEMLQDGLERGEIGVDVGDQSDFHARKIRRTGGKRGNAVRKLDLFILQYHLSQRLEWRLQRLASGIGLIFLE